MCERGRKAAEGMIQIDSEFISIVGREPGRTEGWHFGGGVFSFPEALLRKLVCFTVVRKGLFCRLFFWNPNNGRWQGSGRAK